MPQTILFKCPFDLLYPLVNEVCLPMIILLGALQRWRSLRLFPADSHLEVYLEVQRLVKPRALPHTHPTIYASLRALEAQLPAFHHGKEDKSEAESGTDDK